MSKRIRLTMAPKGGAFSILYYRPDMDKRITLKGQKKEAFPLHIFTPGKHTYPT